MCPVCAVGVWAGAASLVTGRSGDRGRSPISGLGSFSPGSGRDPSITSGTSSHTPADPRLGEVAPPGLSAPSADWAPASLRAPPQPDPADLAWLGPERRAHDPHGGGDIALIVTGDDSCDAQPAH